MIERILTTLEAIAPARPDPRAAPNPPAGGGGQRTPKINDALKPFKLTRDNDPVEFRAWATQFRSFYNTSRLDLLEREDQQAYLRICLDPHLENRISEKIGPTTEIFGDDDSYTGSCK